MFFLVNDLDRELGLLAYSTGQRGIGGLLRSRADDFEVAEVLAAWPPEGRLPTFSVVKVLRNTMEVAQELGDEVGCRMRYWGLKDRRAKTAQVMQCAEGRRSERAIPISRELVGEGWRAIYVGRREPMEPSNFAGNAFRIRIADASAGERLGVVAEVLEEGGIANFFGYQRFGYRDQNHLIGKCIVMWKDGCPPREQLKGMRPQLKRLMVNAYQSYLFNLALSRVLMEREGRSMPSSPIAYEVARKPCPRAVGEARSGIEGVPAAPVPGYAYRGRGDIYSRALDEVMEEEGVMARDFYIDWMQEASDEGGWRPAALLGSMSSSAGEGGVTITACLQRGSYATVLLRELMKPEDPVAAGLAY